MVLNPLRLMPFLSIRKNVVLVALRVWRPATVIGGFADTEALRKPEAFEGAAREPPGTISDLRLRCLTSGNLLSQLTQSGVKLGL